MLYLSVVSEESKYKHRINDIVCEWLFQKKRRPLVICETHQFHGDATKIYRKYGCVVSFEKDSTNYNIARLNFPDAFSLEAINSHGLHFTDLLTQYGISEKYPCIMPSYPTDSLTSITDLPSKIFNVVDVDPYGSPHDWFPEVFRLLNDESILLVTTGEMWAARFDSDLASKPYSFKADMSLNLSKKIFRDDTVLYMGYDLINKALKEDLILYPIFIYDYWTKISGVQRIGFLIKRKYTVSQKINLTYMFKKDPIMKSYFLKYECDKCERSKLYRFSPEKNKRMFEEYLIRRLNYLSSL